VTRLIGALATLLAALIALLAPMPASAQQVKDPATICHEKPDGSFKRILVDADDPRIKVHTKHENDLVQPGNVTCPLTEDAGEKGAGGCKTCSKEPKEELEQVLEEGENAPPELLPDAKQRAKEQREKRQEAAKADGKPLPGTGAPLPALAGIVLAAGLLAAGAHRASARLRRNPY
jgi:hypothetical protein